MRLEAENSLVEEPTEEDLRHIFGDDDARGGFVILTSDDGSFLQAAGKGWSPYTLEFFPDQDAARYQQATTQLTKDQVLAAFTDFLHNGEVWRSSFDWRELDEKKGCVPALLISGGVILSLAYEYYLLSRGV
jgi:hypothetical protein